MNMMLHICIFLTLYLTPSILARCTKTRTVYTTVTGGTRTTRSEYPSTTVYLYSSTVLVGTPYKGPHPFKYSDPANPVNCGYYTGTDIPPPPSSVPPASNLPVSSVQARDAYPAQCSTVKTTQTVKYLCIETDLIYPPAVKISKKGTLTTKVPDFCAAPRGEPTGNGPAGNVIFDLSYPYFAQTLVECCIYCSEQYKDLVAAAFIKSGLDCECLVNNGTRYSGKSSYCPRGVEPYALGKKKGNALLGPCAKAP